MDLSSTKNVVFESVVVTTVSMTVPTGGKKAVSLRGRLTRPTGSTHAIMLSFISSVQVSSHVSKLDYPSSYIS